MQAFYSSFVYIITPQITMLLLSSFISGKEVILVIDKVPLWIHYIFEWHLGV
jgi:hypothetical protein